MAGGCYWAFEGASSECALQGRRRSGDKRPYNRAVRGSRGFTLIESLVALLILSLVITTSLATFYDRHRRLRTAEETILAWQAIANEAEVLRRVELATLRDATAFTTSAALLEQLDEVKSTITVEEAKPGTKLVRVRVEWRGNRKAEVTVVRTSTGGGPLW